MRYKLRANYNVNLNTTTIGDNITLTLKEGSVYDGTPDSNSYSGTPGFFDTFNLAVIVGSGLAITIPVPSSMVDEV